MDGWIQSTADTGPDGNNGSAVLVGLTLELPLNPRAPEHLVAGGKTNSDGSVTDAKQLFDCESVQRPVLAAAVDALPTLDDRWQPEAVVQTSAVAYY